MASFHDFKQGDEVFVLDSDFDFVGVTILSDPQESAGTVRCRVEVINGIPGYEVGDEIDALEDCTVLDVLTVDNLRAMHEVAPLVEPADDDKCADCEEGECYDEDHAE